MPIPASYLTNVTPSASDSSAPHTPSGSASVITAVKASIGSPFFHAHLQEGRRIDGSDAVSSSSSAGGPGARSGASTSSPRGASTLLQVTPRHAGPSSGAGQKLRDASEAPHGSRTRADPQPAQKSARGAGARVAVPVLSAKAQLQLQGVSPSPARQVPPRAMAFPLPLGVDEQDVWMAAASAQAAAAAGVADPPSKRYHYMTRSQSLDAGLQQQAPRMRKQNASYNAAYGAHPFPVTMRTAEDPHASNANSGPWATAPPAVRGRHLSPIEEQASYFGGERQGDTASLRSNTSTQSNLFIHRSVRRTPSTSTFNSTQSAAGRGGAGEDSPARGYGHGRGFGDPLPVIPASPRESQNVFEPDHPMMPGIFPHEAPPFDHGAYSVPFGEQDLADTGYAVFNDKKPLTHTRFALATGTATYTEEDDESSIEEQDLGAPTQPSRTSRPHSRTPSLLSRSDSVRTELTYLTAQDSAPGSRRASAVPDLEANRRRSRLASVTNADEQSENMASRAVARMKASFDTLFTRAAKSPSPVQAVAESSKPVSTRRTSTSVKSIAALKSVRVGAPTWAAHARAQVTETFRGGKPAEVLFWTGFLAPWCWLIGGWMLSRGSGDAPPTGQVVVKDEAGNEVGASWPRTSAKRQPQQGQQVSLWDAARGSSAELLTALRGERAHVPDKEKGPDVVVTEAVANGDANANMDERIENWHSRPARVGDALREGAMLDPWVARCRVAAVLAGMLLLALCIVALIVLVRSL